MSPIGVDEWVARSGERRDRGSGPLESLRRLGDRVGWWQRLAVLALVGFLFGHIGANGFQQTVAFNAVIYAILAVGLNIVVGWAGLLDLGYVAFYGIGAYGFALLSSSAFGNLMQQTGGVQLPAYASIPIVLVFAGLVGLAIGLVSLRLGGDYLAIVTLFFGIAFAEVVNNVDPAHLGGPDGITSLNPIQGLGGAIGSTIGYYYLALIVLIALMAGLHLLDASRTGRAWRAVRDDPLAAQVMTIPVNAVKVMAFSFGAIVAALAGAIFAAQQTNVFPTNFQSPVLILIYACLVLGGVGSIAGAVLGGVLVTVVQQMLASPTDAGYLFYGLIILALVVRVRPWRVLGAMLAAIVAFGFAARAIVGAISHAAIAGSTGSVGWIGSVLRHFVIVPANPMSYGNVLYVLLICALVGIVRLKGIWRLIATVPTVYFGACCWEARLSVDPAITAQIMIGAILIVMMAVRPEGLLGSRRVEII
ncbi:MAG: branched-chain amino acid ABC transporter permease [Solirubrobacteraceae bacterium]|jgi:branched-chain amino acid transport system permease protein